MNMGTFGGTDFEITGDDYYYNYSEQMSLTTVQEYVVAKEDPGSFTTWGGIIAGSPALSSEFTPQQMADGFTLLGVNPGYSFQMW